MKLLFLNTENSPVIILYFNILKQLSPSNEGGLEQSGPFLY